ncbi:MAG: polysaccharide biosynthesis C-terminal domain-containing protein [Lachnospiraceae bacterium]|nr:polysaccharide biosynthesis C-terminal domain-containing protein [Lachnospiraceae bacterium]
MGKTKGRYRYLFSNMALFTVSSFISKMLVFFLVPFYTTVLSEAEYGVADVMATTLLIAVPVLTVNAGEAALRFALGGSDPDEILRIGLTRVIRACAVIAAICLAAFFADRFGLFSGVAGGAPLGTYALMFLALFVSDAFYEYMLLYCQGIDRVKVMITGSVSCTALTIASNMVFLLVVRLGLYGYLFSQMTAFSLSALLMFFLVKGRERLSRPGLAPGKEEYKKLDAEMGEYGSSMMLYAVSSWINNAIDRYYILFMLGSAVNGLYGVAYRIPAILTTFQRIFAQAFQMSAVREYRKEDGAEFFSGLYRMYNAAMVLCCAAILLVLKPIALLLFRKGFYDAWRLVPPLLIAVIFGALEGFLGSICLAFKDGKSIGRATCAGAVVNIVLNFVLIRHLGAFGAALSTLFSYFTMFILAWKMVERHIQLNVGRARDFAAYVLLGAESFVLLSSFGADYLLNAAIVILLAVLYGKEITEVYKKCRKRFGRKIA